MSNLGKNFATNMSSCWEKCYRKQMLIWL